MQSQNTIHDSSVDYNDNGGKLDSGLKQSKSSSRNGTGFPSEKLKETSKGARRSSSYEIIIYCANKKLLRYGTVCTNVYISI